MKKGEKDSLQQHKKGGQSRVKGETNEKPAKKPKERTKSALLKKNMEKVRLSHGLRYTLGRN